MNQYSKIAKVLHWSVAGLIVGQYVLAKLAEYAERQDNLLDQLALLANHKSVGITILLLAVVRLVYRFNSSAPPLPDSMTTWQVNASKASHFLLYGFLFALPISGWLMSSATAYSVSWFNLIALPDFVAPNEMLADQLHAVHHYLAEALFVVAVIHLIAALKHHFIDRDEVLMRMSSKANWLLFAIVIVLVVGFFGRVFSTQPSQEILPTPNVKQASQANLDDKTSQLAQSDLPIWDIDYAQSYIKFSGDQAGAPFQGEWTMWSAKIQFDARQLSKARFDVVIDVNSGFSNDQERDDTIRSPEFFDVAVFPEAYYRADIFSSKEGQFEAIGKLSMKGATADSILSFDVVEDGGQRVLTGSAILDRLRWNIGSGDWVDTSWVGKDVSVEVRVVTK